MTASSAEAGKVCLLGVPFDAASSFMAGAAGAPAAIRRVMHSGASNLFAENGFDLGDAACWHDAGDVACGNTREDLALIERSVDRLLTASSRVLMLGGDHSISFPALTAYARHFPHLTILHLDAHPDLYDELDGDRLSHGCPFARIMEARLADRLVQVGIRTMNPHQAAQARRFGVEVHAMNEWNKDIRLELQGPVYVSIDLDVLDPAYAPGVSHHEPGGMSVRELLAVIQAVPAPVVGADIVEYNPRRDSHDRTAMVCVKLVKELSARLAQS